MTALITLAYRGEKANKEFCDWCEGYGINFLKISSSIYKRCLFDTDLYLGQKNLHLYRLLNVKTHMCKANRETKRAMIYT
eukprot:snap_masked-scaffold_1-processed-gene-24.25-mRNA-1 protein AED:1.00 eAED:1.00 QI:0/0/0/0/1/1/2/0/79